MPVAPLQILPANGHIKAPEGVQVLGSRSPCIHMGDSDEVPGFWLWPGPASAHGKPLSISSQINKTFVFKFLLHSLFCEPGGKALAHAAVSPRRHMLMSFLKNFPQTQGANTLGEGSLHPGEC